MEVSINVPELPEVLNLTVQTSTVSVFDQVSQATMAEVQTKDSVLGLFIQYVHKGDKQNGSAISKIKCEAAWKYLLQFYQLVMKQGVLH